MNAYQNIYILFIRIFKSNLNLRHHARKGGIYFVWYFDGSLNKWDEVIHARKGGIYFVWYSGRKNDLRSKSIVCHQSH